MRFLAGSWWRLLSVVTAAVMLSKGYWVLPGIQGSVRGKAPPQPHDGAGQTAHLQHPVGLVILLGQDPRAFIHFAD
jgi:hypothetical protein